MGKECSLGSPVTSTRANMREIGETATEKCTGPMVLSTRVNGEMVCSTVKAS